MLKFILQPIFDPFEIITNRRCSVQHPLSLALSKSSVHQYTPKSLASDVCHIPQDHDVDIQVRIEHVFEKTNNLGYGQVRHKSGCTVRGWKLRKKRNCTIRVAKTKAMISYCEADLRLCFRLCRLLVFPCGGSISKIPLRRLLHFNVLFNSLRPDMAIAVVWGVQK